jgi:hypothetical protein
VEYAVLASQLLRLLTRSPPLSIGNADVYLRHATQAISSNEKLTTLQPRVCIRDGSGHLVVHTSDEFT